MTVYALLYPDGTLEGVYGSDSEANSEMEKHHYREGGISGMWIESFEVHI